LSVSNAIRPTGWVVSEKKLLLECCGMRIRGVEACVPGQRDAIAREESTKERVCVACSAGHSSNIWEGARFRGLDLIATR
jgi:hypothetical protein